jgi:hypothetical protein
LVSQYVEGKIFCSPEEVAANVYLAEDSFLQYKANSKYRAYFAQRMETIVHTENKTWMQAAKLLRKSDDFEVKSQLAYQEYEDRKYFIYRAYGWRYRG